MSKKLSPQEKAKRRKAMADIDQKADCSGHNHQVTSGPGPFLGGMDFLSLYLLTRAAMKSRRKV